MNFLQCLLLLFFLTTHGSNFSQACTTFCLGDENQPVYGRNFDWNIGDGQIFINKRGSAKKAISIQQNDPKNSLSWVSKYGSASFNLFGREFPLGGMNEAGLVIESLVLEETRYPSEDSRPEIMVSQWIQYQLDNSSGVADVVASDAEIRIGASRDSKLHFLVCERSGACATIEFIGGKLKTHTRKNLPVKVLSNSSYSDSLAYLKKKSLPESDENKSIERFILSAKSVRDYAQNPAAEPVNYAFTVLENAQHDSFTTQWSTVYDIANLTIYFRTASSSKIRYLDLSSFDLSCSTPVKVIDLQADYSGDIAPHFLDFSYQANRNHLRNVYRKSFFSTLPDHILDKFSAHPDSISCQQ